MSKGLRTTITLAVPFLLFLPAFAQQNAFFTPGNLVVAVEGCGVHGGTCTNVANGSGTGSGNSSVGGYGDNQASPLTLFQYTPNGTAGVTFVNSLVLPETASGANLALAGEYGSSSEGTLQLSGAGQYLTLMGYGINANTFNANPDLYSATPNIALAQSSSLTGQQYTPIPRVLTLIDANGNVNSATAVYNIFDTNNPRSAYTLNGTTAYLSGQGTGADSTGGVFYIPVGSQVAAPTAITGLDTTSKTIAQDTREVQIINNTLYVSVDSKEGSGSNRDFIGTLGTPPATSLFNSGNGPTQLNNFATSGAGKETITSGSNGDGNNLNAGQKINLSPVNYFFASPSVLYVADSGFPKNDSNGDTNSNATANIGDGGLQKWTNTKSDGSGTWNLAYTLYQGLNLVNNGGSAGTTGLYGLAGVVSGNNVLFYATNYTIADLDPTFLYGITDNLTFTTASQAAGETFTQLEVAPPDSNFKGVSFAPSIPAGDVEVTSSPSGLVFTSSGTGCAPGTYSTPVTLSWTPGSNCTLSVVSPQAAGTGVQYAFSQWEDGTTSTNHIVTAPATTAVYNATFNTQYLLTTAAGAGGSVSPGGYFNSGTQATITATPSTGNYFVNFTGTSTSTNNPFLLTMNSPQTITANFAAQASQSITFTMPPPQSAAYGSSFTVAATGGGSGNPVVFTSAGSCSNSGATYTMTSGAGTCSVIANQSGNTDYLAAPQVTQTATATTASGPGSIYVTTTSVASGIYPKQADALTATVTVVGLTGAPTGSGETVSFYAGATLLGTGTLSTVDANDSSTTINITGSQLASGANNLTAVYSGDVNYSSTTAAPIAVTLLSPSVSFGSSNVGSVAAVQTLTYTFTSATTLSAVNILTAGKANLDFIDGGSSTCATTAYTAGQSCTVTASFTPSAPGARAGAVTFIAQESNLPLMTWYLDGTGQSGAVTIDPGTQTPTTLTGTQTPAGYGTAVDGFGNVYVADHANGAVLKLAAGTFSQSTVVSGLSSPAGVTLDGAGNLYIATASGVVLVPNENETLNPADQSTLSIAGLGSARAVAIDASGNVYVADSSNGNVVELSSLGVQTTIASQLTNPTGVAVDANGNVYVSAGTTVTEYPAGGGAPIPYGTSFSSPQGIAVDAAGAVYVADTDNNTVVRVAPGGASQSPVIFGNVGISAPQSVSVDSADNLYITSPGAMVQVKRTQAMPLTFPSTNVGSTSTTQSVTVTNAGNQALQFSNLAISANFSSEPSGQTDCASSTNLTSGGQCGIGVAFAPSSSGTLTGTVTLTDSALNNPASSQSVALSGGASQVSQTITFTTNPPPSAVFGTSFTVAATASSGLPVTYASSGSCSNSGPTYTMTSGTGACLVTASQPGNAEYSAAQQITETVSAMLASQSITVTVPAPPTATLNNSFTISASATSGLPITFASSGGCTNSGATYTMAATGTRACIETMTQPGNGNYSPATQVFESTSVARAITPTVSFTGAPATAVYATSFTVVASSNSTSIPTFTTTGPCTINSATLLVTMTSGTGTCAMTATWAANDVYAKASAIQRTAATKAVSVISWSNPSSIVYGTPLSGTQLNAAANTSGTFVYSPPAGRILPVGLQSLSVRFTPSAPSNYTTVTDDVDLTVTPVNTTTTITLNTPNPSTVGRAVAFSFTVTQAITNPTKPTGTATITASTGESCATNLQGGKGTCKITFTTSGTRTVTASYPGDANNNGSVSADVTQTVN
jgi:sugar lactone lactonase YvrE